MISLDVLRGPVARIPIALLAWGALAVLAAGAAGADLLPGMEAQPSPERLWEASWTRFVEAWESFGNWRSVVAQLFELLLAAALALAIALHPRNHTASLVFSLDVIDQPKTLTLYAVIAVVVAEIVQIYPAMAFVVFGIGGLMRFRTDLGVPKLTGRAILVTVIGLAVGLELFPLALLATLFGWILIWFLEARTAVRIEMSRVPKGRVDELAGMWREVLDEVGCQIVTLLAIEQREEIEIFLTIPSDLDPEDLKAVVRDRFGSEEIGRVKLKIL